MTAPRKIMETNGFREALGPLYPELGTSLPDPQAHADSVIVRVLNAGPDRLREQMLAYYGQEKVRTVAQARVNRLDTPVYRAWKTRLQLPDRSAAVERIQRLWRQ
jgi:hypothetical protein